MTTNVYNYGEQVEANLGDYHHDKDDYPGWLITYTRTGKHVYENDPIVVGAWLIPSVVMLALMVVIDRLLGKPQEAMA
ncbi:hypothetical protein [Pseudomonas aeruginosa]|uniref:hypothetical protein n=1 Tax=Pseudomonas aeruginosa TaxID=287 RepID=UPI00352738A9